MTRVHRRRFLAGTGAVVFAGHLARPALAQAKPRVIVIGGGPGGATAAKYIAKDSNGAIEVTLVEPQRAFTTCFHSNLFLGGFRDWASIIHSYDKLASGYGVRLVHKAVAAIDRNARTIRLADGAEMGYDRLVVAPGIDLRFDSRPGLFRRGSRGHAARLEGGAADATPEEAARRARRRQPDRHGGAAEPLPLPARPLRARLDDGACAEGQGPQEVAASSCSTRSDSFSKQALFQEGWERHYPAWSSGRTRRCTAASRASTPSTMTVKTDLETYKAALVNVIPAQMAGKIARDAGLANQTGLCPVDPASMKSASDPNVYVVGDACIPGDMPKSAFSANSQAKVAAMMVRGELARRGPSRPATPTPAGA